MEEFLRDFSTHLSSPEDYVNPTEEQKAKSLDLLKGMFDFYKKFSSEHLSGLETRAGCKHVDTGPLTELYVEGLDEDQVWEQIELVNQPVIKGLRGVVGKLSTQLDSYRQERDMPEMGLRTARGEELRNEPELEEEFEDGLEDEFGEKLEDEDEMEEEGGRGGKLKPAKGKSSVVDDMFFKLSDMEKFLEMAEREEAAARGKHAISALS